MTRLLVVCAEGIDWASCQPARLGAVKAQKLAALRVRGTAGWLSGAALGFGAASAVTLATGVQPDAHGVWRNEENWAGGLRPAGNASWRVQPVWTRLEAAGVSTASVGWPASRPGANWPGRHIDDSFAEPTGADHETWALPLGCAPAAVRMAIRNRRVHPNQIGDAVLAPFEPGPGETCRAPSRVVEALRFAVARAASVQAAAVWTLVESEQAAPDAMFVHQPFLKQVQHAVAGSDPRLVQSVTSAAWRLLDGLIGRLVDLCEPDRSILLASPGWGGGAGVVVAAGSGLKKNSSFEGGSILDIAPTVLAWFGLEDRSLPGRSLAVPGDGVPLRTAPSATVSRRPSDHIEILEPLLSLGYAAPPKASAPLAAAEAAELALLLLDREPERSLMTAEAALVLDPDCVTALRVKSRAHVALRQAEPLEAVGERLNRLAPQRGWGAAAIAAGHVLRGEIRKATPWLKRAEEETDLATLTAVATLWTASGRLPDAARVFRRIATVDPGNVTAEIGLAMAATARRDFLEAEAGLQRAREREPGRPGIWLQLAQIYALSGRKDDAIRMAAKARRLGALPTMAKAAAAGRLAA